MSLHQSFFHLQAQWPSDPVKTGNPFADCFLWWEANQANGATAPSLPKAQLVGLERSLWQDT